MANVECFSASRERKAIGLNAADDGTDAEEFPEAGGLDDCGSLAVEESGSGAPNESNQQRGRLVSRLTI